MAKKKTAKQARAQKPAKPKSLGKEIIESLDEGTHVIEQATAPSEYSFIRAIKDGEGNLRWEWQLKTSAAKGGLRHDEDVTDFTREDIQSLTVAVLELNAADAKLVEIHDE